jgi:tRNA splicing endonuclease
MDLSKIINKVLLESDGVEEFYGVEEYTKDIQMEQEIKKLANTLRPFIQRVARESMYVVDRNKKEIRNILFDFIQTYLENDSNEGPIDTQVESIKTEEQDPYPVDFNRENKFRLIIFLLNLFSNYINDYEGGNMNNEKMIRKNKELIRMDLIHFIQIYLEESDDINESNIDMNIESIIRKVLIEEFIQVNEFLYEDIHGSVEEVNLLQEAEYQGRKVQLGKIMQGDIKKFKVYVKNDKGKVVKVNFGFGGKSAKGKRMVIKKNNPERRRSFRARHNCDNPGPRWKPRYWACRTW